LAKPKSRKINKTISFDPEVLQALEQRCKSDGVCASTFVNLYVRRIVMSEYEFYRQLTKNAAIELSKYQTLMETARDKPKGK